MEGGGAESGGGARELRVSRAELVVAKDRKREGGRDGRERERDWDGDGLP